MKIDQARWLPGSGWDPDSRPAPASLVLAFGSPTIMADPAAFRTVRDRYPDARVVGCSTAGNILDATLSDDDLTVAALALEHGSVRIAARIVTGGRGEAREVGRSLAGELGDGNLRLLFVLADGLAVNGSELAAGLAADLPPGVTVTGGLAGDADKFKKTWVMADGPARQGQIVAAGFYGMGLQVKTGCFAGWEEFGPQRLVTRAQGNEVFTIDDQPALDLYKRFLGAQAGGLPASGLRFPLSIHGTRDGPPLIRTLLRVDEERHSLTFAGDVPEGHFCRLMKTNLDRLVEHAGLAAAAASQPGDAPTLALLVTCVGRRLVLGQLTEEELEAVRHHLGPAARIAGFYSYGELAPAAGTAPACHLHNQTLTLATLREA